MNKFAVCILFTVFIAFQLIFSVLSQSVQSRHYRPYYPNKCNRNGRCPSRDGYIEEDDQDFKTDKDRPPELTRDDWPVPSGGGRPGTGADYKPPVVDRDEYDPKSVVDRDSYDPKPAGGGYNRKPPVDRDDYKPKPVDDGGPVGGGYNRKPPVDRDEYKPKPVDDEGVYNPKPVVDRDDYIPRPVGEGGGGGGGGGYYPKPVADDLNRRPIGDKKDLGGYGDPKDDDYNDDYGIRDGSKDEDYIGVIKPIPVVDGNCICVPYYQCQDGHIVTDGAGIIDARKRPEPDEELPLDGKFKPPSCGPFHVCCNTPETSTVKPYEHRCGVRNPSGINSRILSPSNKGEADFGEWPWQAAVLKAEGKVNIFQCGGVLIDKYHVLTVAHCVFHL
ncbi:Proclotting enzyme, partial [Stegodyphus mimosarum]